MEKDSGETVNLASNPKFANVLAGHRRRLRAQIEALGDGYGRSLLASL